MFQLRRLTPTLTAPRYQGWAAEGGYVRWSAPQLRSYSGQLTLLRLERLPGQAQGVVEVARDHVQVEVEDRLPSGGLAGVQEVDAVAAELVAHAERQPFRGGDRALEILVGRVVEVARVVARDHERVPARPWVDVHERDRVLVLLDDLRRQLAGGDLAEDAVFVRHGRAAYSQPARLKRK